MVSMVFSGFSRVFYGLFYGFTMNFAMVKKGWPRLKEQLSGKLLVFSRSFYIFYIGFSRFLLCASKKRFCLLFYMCCF